jgi:riboflavin kinase
MSPESWKLHELGLFVSDNAGEELRVLVTGYIRPEANFESLEALIKRIHRDADVTRQALEDERLVAYKHDAFLQPRSVD